MKHLAALLALLASSVQAQTVTIPAQNACTTVPAQTVCVALPARTITVVGTAPPTCTPPQTLSNGVCVDPAPSPVTTGGLVITGQGASSISMTWPAVSGAASYRVYRNGASYATPTGTSYTDSKATSATVWSYDSPATIYSYAIAALNAAGAELSRTSGATYWVLHSGVMAWQQYSYGLNQKLDANGILITPTASGSSGFQPYASGNVPQYDLEAGSFTYFTMDVQPTQASQTFNLSAHSRVPQPPGDVYSTQLLHLENYCALDIAKKVTCKIPLADFHIGKTAFTGSISGNTMTVTQSDANLIDKGGYVTGLNVAHGTWIQDGPSSGGPGTYTVQPSQTAASGPMAYQRTAIYKWDLMEQQGAAYRIDNVAFTN